MILSDISVKRPVLAAVMSLLLVAVGILYFNQLPVRELPDIDFPIVSVTTRYPGASARVVENRITQIIEDRIAGIEGIKSIDSSSRDGISNVTIEFNLSRDIDVASNDVRERIARVTQFLPEEADPPEIAKVNADERSILWFNLQSFELDSLQLTDFAERNIQDRLSVVDGVARVQIGGNKRYAMRIWVDRTALAARGLTVSDIEAALRRENVELPAGRLESAELDFTVRVERGYGRPEDFEQLVIAQGADGHLIRLSEVARVEIGPADERQEFRGDGRSSIGIGIVKQSKANTLAVAQGAKREAERIRETLPPSIRLVDSYDRSVFIEEAIKEVYRTLFIAVGLVIMVIYLFLGSFRAALVPAVTVPVALVGTFTALGVAGFSINLLTLLALVLTIGLVVDDSIVVLENIYRRIERGDPALLASYRGARQVSFAVIATTLVLVGVFSPVIFLEGTTARLFSELALTLTAAVVISTFVALSLSPMMCSKLLGRKVKKSRLNKFLDDSFVKLNNFYEIALRACLRAKSAILLVLLGSLFLISGLMRAIPAEFVPDEDRGGIFISMRGPDGIGFEAMRKELLTAEDLVMDEIRAGGAVERVLFILPGFFSANEINSAVGILILKDWDEREATTQDVIEHVRELLEPVTGVTTFVRGFSGTRGAGGSTPVDFVVGANTYEELAEFREILLAAVAENPGLTNADIEFRLTKPQVRLEVDRDRAADLGVPVQEVGRTLETMLGGRQVTTYVDRGEEYDVMLQADPADRADIRDIDNIYVRSARTGELVPLASLVRLTETADAPRLERHNRIRSLELTANLAPGYKLGDALSYLQNTVLERLPNATQISLKGDSREFQESQGAIQFAFTIALLVVFLILAAQFESFVHPFVIMLTVPLAISGGLFGLLVTGDSLNLYSQVGLIILVGIASKNGILIVEFANQLRDHGRTVEAAVIEASKIRLRPIMMTGISTAMGSLPLILATGPGSVSRGSIGVVIFSGVIFATFFTLFVIPVFYRIFAPFTGSPGAIARKLAGQVEEDAGSQRPAPAE